MAKTIQQYAIQTDRVSELVLPVDAKVLAVRDYGNHLALIVEEPVLEICGERGGDVSDLPAERSWLLTVVREGETLPDSAEYLGTTLTYGTRHLYRLRP